MLEARAQSSEPSPVELVGWGEEPPCLSDCLAVGGSACAPRPGKGGALALQLRPFPLR